MSAARLERLVNLTIALMATPRPLTVADLAATVYGEPGEDGAPVRPDPASEAFRRMFERDKEALREQGIPLRATPVSSWDDNEIGYRVPRQDYSLPDLHLDPDEAAALGLAARLWQSARLAEGVSSALRKLESVGEPVGQPALGDGLSARVQVGEPAFEPVLAALQERRAVRFAYRGARDTEPRERTVEPWGMVSWHGRWYVVGHDRERGAERVFRLSRVTSDVRRVGQAGVVTVPEGLDLRARVEAAEPRELRGTARVRVPVGGAHALRRRATADEALPATEPGGPGGPGGEVLLVPFADAERLAEQVAGLAPDVVVLDPPEVRAAVLRLLRGTAAAHAPVPA